MTLQRDLVRQAPKRPSRGVIALLLAALGIVLTVGGFLAGINAGLDGSGSGFYVALFLVGLVASVAALVLAVVGLIIGTSRVLCGVALAIALLPGLAMFALVLVVNARS